MSEKQNEPLSPPLVTDRDVLADYSSVIQRNLENLFELAHKHRYKTTVPMSNEGQVGDIYLVEDSSTFKIYIKFPSGWKSATLA